MKTIALRFAENFAPKCGTIKAHEEIIDKHGYVWYGKLGSAVSFKVISTILSNDEPKILLIRSGRSERYWAYVTDITNKCPPSDEIPTYYRNGSDKFKTWFKVTRFELTDKNIMSQFVVASSKQELGIISKASLSPYFIIESKTDY